MKKFQIQYVDISTPIPSEYNSRESTEVEDGRLDESITRFDLIEPLTLNSAPNRKNIIIGGHFRLRRAKELGFTQVPVVYVHIPDVEKEKELNLRLNANTGHCNNDKLFKEFDIDMMLDVGMDKQLFKYWEENLGIDDDDDFDVEKEIEKIKEPRTRSGQLILLGDQKFGHRLFCGDSTLLQSVDTLVDAQKVHTFNFDPIYNIGFDYNNGFGKKGKYGGSAKDKRSDEEYKQFLKTIFQNGLKFAHPDLHVFCWCDETYIGLIQSLYTDLGITNRRVCLWIKNSQNPTPQIAFNKAYEPCVYGTIGNPYLSPSVKNLNEVMNKEVSTGNRLPDDIMDLFNIWLVKRVSGQDYEHPTQKPPTLYEKALRRCTKPGDIILDLFAGSGSLMVAAEQMKRRVFMCEIDPVFCDVIVARYERLTGKEAIYVNPKK